MGRRHRLMLSAGNLEFKDGVAHVVDPYLRSFPDRISMRRALLKAQVNRQSEYENRTPLTVKASSWCPVYGIGMKSVALPSTTWTVPRLRVRTHR
jgi:hypothetical protein